MLANCSNNSRPPIQEFESGAWFITDKAQMILCCCAIFFSMVASAAYIFSRFPGPLKAVHRLSFVFSTLHSIFIILVQFIPAILGTQQTEICEDLKCTELVAVLVLLPALSATQCGSTLVRLFSHNDVLSLTIFCATVLLSILPISFLLLFGITSGRTFCTVIASDKSIRIVAVTITIIYSVVALAIESKLFFEAARRSAESRMVLNGSATSNLVNDRKTRKARAAAFVTRIDIRFHAPLSGFFAAFVVVDLVLWWKLPSQVQIIEKITSAYLLLHAILHLVSFALAYRSRAQYEEARRLIRGVNEPEMPHAMEQSYGAASSSDDNDSRTISPVPSEDGPALPVENAAPRSSSGLQAPPDSTAAVSVETAQPDVIQPSTSKSAHTSWRMRKNTKIGVAEAMKEKKMEKKHFEKPTAVEMKYRLQKTGLDGDEESSVEITPVEVFRKEGDKEEVDLRSSRSSDEPSVFPVRRTYDL